MGDCNGAVLLRLEDDTSSLGANLVQLGLGSQEGFDPGREGCGFRFFCEVLPYRCIGNMLCHVLRYSGSAETPKVP